jgi:hypothetical protein
MSAELGHLSACAHQPILPDHSSVNKNSWRLFDGQFDILSQNLRVLIFIWQPMFQREALWIEFYWGESRKEPCAIKVSVGGDSIYKPRHRVRLLTDFRDQCYHWPTSGHIANHKQPWLNGVCVSPGIVRQVRIRVRVVIQLSYNNNPFSLLQCLLVMVTRLKSN